MQDPASKQNLASRISRARGVIFDMDGTILDSYDAHYKAWNRLLSEQGLRYTRDQVVAQFGKPTPIIASILFHTTDKVFTSRIAKQKAEYFIEEVTGITLFPGTLDLLEALKARGKKTCIASSSANMVIEKVIAEFRLESLIDAFVGLGDITSSKPHPEMIFKSCDRIGLAPADCIVVGDTEYDIKAGNAAGCFTIGVLTSNFSREQLLASGAGAVLQSVGAMLDLVV